MQAAGHRVPGVGTPFDFAFVQVHGQLSPFVEPSAARVTRVRAGRAAVVWLRTVCGRATVPAWAFPGDTLPVQGALAFLRLRHIKQATLVLHHLPVGLLLPHLSEAAGAVPVPEPLGAREQSSTPFAPAGRDGEDLLLGAHAPQAAKIARAIKPAAVTLDPLLRSICVLPPNV